VDTPATVIEVERRHAGDLAYLGLALVAADGATWLAGVSGGPDGKLPVIRVNARLAVRRGAVLRGAKVLPTLFCDPATA
jgi:hypothetical protein